MVDSVIRWSLANRGLVLLLAAGLLAWGGYALGQLPVEVLPSLAAPSVTVIAESPGMAPADMERAVTLPLESALNGAPGLRRLRSDTAVGVALVRVDFQWGADLFRARTVVAERMRLAASRLPSGMREPVLAPASSIMGEILFAALESDRHSGVELRTLADSILRRRIVSVPGVAGVVVLGGARKQYQVLLSPERLRFHQATLGEVHRALSTANINTAAGFRQHGGREYLVQGIGRFTGPEEVRETGIRSLNSIPVRLSALGEVRVGEAPKRGTASLNGHPAVMVGVLKLPGVNTLSLTTDLRDRFQEIRRSLPPDVRLHDDVFLQSEFINRAITGLREAALHGGLLAVAVVFLFLAWARASVITIVTIPLALCASFVTLQALGLTLNSMTLGGLAISIGALVDDALIDVENVVRRLRQDCARPEDSQLPTLEVVYRACLEVRTSIFLATLAVVAVFAPVLALENLEGLLLRPLGIAYVVAVLSSLVVALTVTPALCVVLLSREACMRSHGPPAPLRLLGRVYSRVLDRCLDRWPLVLALSVSLVVASAASLHWSGGTFLPTLNEGSLAISATTVPGTSLDQSDRLGTALERVLLEIPEVISTGRRTGRAEADEHLQGVESTEIDVRLEAGTRSREEVLADIRSRASLLPGTAIEISQPISHRIDHMLSGTRSSIAVKIFGPDLRTLRALAARAREEMAGVDGVVDLAAAPQADIPTVAVRFRREDLARHGLPAGTAAEALRTVFLGSEVGTILEDQLPVPVVMRYAGVLPADLETMRRTMIDTPSGARVPLAAVASIREDRSPNRITREGVERSIAVSCNVAGSDLLGVAEGIRQRVDAAVDLPDGYRIEYAGAFESQARATRRILLLGAAVLAGILLALATAFRSTTDALIVMCNLPLALVGGVVGVFLGGGVFSLASLIGFVTLFGVALRNGILLVTHVQQLMSAEGVTDFRDAVVRGSTERIAPVVMTALSTGIALLPVALAQGEPGSEVHSKLALVVVCGLITSTLLNMIVVPATYWRFGSAGRPAR